MFDVNAAKRAAHRANIKRYRRLLQTQLAPHERDYLLTRLEEEQLALSELHGAWGILASYRSASERTPAAQPAA